MASDVKMVRVTATGAARTTRSRLRKVSVLISNAGAGRLTITDGDGGATLFDVDFAANGQASLSVPDRGILAERGLFVSAATNVAAATLFYEG